MTTQSISANTPQYRILPESNLEKANGKTLLLIINGNRFHLYEKNGLLTYEDMKEKGVEKIRRAAQRFFSYPITSFSVPTLEPSFHSHDVPLKKPPQQDPFLSRAQREGKALHVTINGKSFHFYCMEGGRFLDVTSWTEEKLLRELSSKFPEGIRSITIIRPSRNENESLLTPNIPRKQPHLPGSATRSTPSQRYCAYQTMTPAQYLPNTSPKPPAQTKSMTTTALNKTHPSSADPRVDKLRQQFLALQEEYATADHRFFDGSRLLYFHDCIRTNIEIELNLSVLVKKIGEFSKEKLKGIGLLKRDINELLNEIYFSIHNETDHLQAILEKPPSSLLTTGSHLRTWYFELQKRINHLYSLGEITYFKVDDLTKISDLKAHLSKLEDKLPDSDFVRTMKSIGGALEKLFSFTDSKRVTGPYDISCGSNNATAQLNRTLSHQNYLYAQQAYAINLQQHSQHGY